MNIRHLPLMIFAVALFMTPLPWDSAHGGTYRWVDENGEVHYGDQIPPEYLNKGYSVLSKRGVTTKEVEQAKTDQQLAEEERLAELKEEEAIRQKNGLAYDKNLIYTYTKEQDLIDTRDRHIATLDGQIKVSEFKVGNLKNKLAELSRVAKRRKDEGKPKQDDLGNNIAILQRQINDELQSIQSRHGQQQVLRDRFTKDLQRYRDLKGMETTPSPQSTK